MVKNFCISKYEYSAFFCTKSHCHILKTCENSHQWSATILKQKILKVSNFQKSIFQKYFFHCFKMVALHWWLFSRVFKIWKWFLVKKKAEYSYFEMQKFLLPPVVFTPYFMCGIYWKSDLNIQIPHVQTKKGGKKLVEGVKNFCIF